MRVTVLVVAFLVAPTLDADVSLPSVFGDHMVLQRGMEIPVWGNAARGEDVTVTLGDLTRTAMPDDDNGRWLVRFPALDASVVPVSLTVRGRNVITLRDVLVGEVWVCAGQSNMEWPLERAANAERELAGAGIPRIRLLQLRGAARGGSGRYTAEHLARLTPETFCHGRWEVSTPDSASSFSAVGYYFGRYLHEKLGVPIGLISPAIGGTPTEAWIRREALAADPGLRELVRPNWLENEQLGEWCRERARSNLGRALTAGETIPGDAVGPNHSFKPAFMWQAGIEPLIPYAVRGVIWYQGESNAESPDRVKQHRQLFPLLVRDWRGEWRQGRLPFLYVQLPGMGRPDWPEFRNDQRRFLAEIPDAGMAVTIDVGHPTNVHPTVKQPVGERLARWALGATYGDRDIVYSGPLFRSATVRGASMLIDFEHIGTGLTTNDGEPPRHFEVAGPDGVFRTARARIDEGSVRVWNPGVTEPRRVRYAWAPYPRPQVNLVNREGLPASPFVTPKRTELRSQQQKQPK